MKKLLILLMLSFPFQLLAHDCQEWLEIEDDDIGEPTTTVLVKVDHIVRVIKPQVGKIRTEVKACNLDIGGKMECITFKTRQNYRLIKKRLLECTVKK